MRPNAPVIVAGEEHLGYQIRCRGCDEHFPRDEEFYRVPERPVLCRACEYEKVNETDRARKRAWYWRHAETQKEKARLRYAALKSGGKRCARG